jgi:hypothetical protein
MKQKWGRGGSHPSSAPSDPTVDCVKALEDRSMTILAQPPKSAKAARKAEPTMTLALAINHIVYSVTLIPDVKDIDVIKCVRLEKKGDSATYDVAMVTRGLSCSCPDWQARHADFNTSGCKHIRACVHFGLLEQPKAAPAPPVTPPPTPAPATAPQEPCCPDSEPAPCTACVEPPTAEASPGDAWDDEGRWELGPGDDEPTDVRHGGQDEPRLPFDAWIACQANWYRSFGTEAADWLADEIGRLAAEVRALEARCPSEFEARSEAMLRGL